MNDKRREILAAYFDGDDADFGKIGEAELHTLWGILAFIRDLHLFFDQRKLPIEMAQDWLMYQERLEFLCDRYEAERH